MQFWLKKFVALGLCLCAVGQAQSPTTQSSGAGPLNFKAWKDQQVLEAQNQVLRQSTKLTQARSNRNAGGEGPPEKSATLPSSRVKKSADPDSTAMTERDLKRAQESLDAAEGLQFEDYVNIYIPSLQDQPDMIGKLVEKLSKEELGQIVKNLVQKNSKTVSAPRPSASLLGGVAVVGPR